MTVRIYLDLDKLHLVARGQRHRARLARVPNPGDQVTMLCGLVEVVEYTTEAEKAVATCWTCDVHYRRGLGFPIPPTHPGFSSGRRTPRKRRYTSES
ncbi:zinc finger protein [Amycolatopsis sp. NPDC051128]|uniref:zinc finger protein n=1 Tax=Amycolatopsis sp. NPDC051128 TaxID=3155412 RepID=UPI003441D822